MDAREILNRVRSGELDLGSASAQLRGTETEAPTREPIAVIGCSARFPGAEDAEQFWNLLLDGADLVTEVPADRWSASSYFDADPAAAGKSTSKWGAFVSDADAFDADFFRMTPREAELTDPQARLFLQESWRALENAGLAPATLAGARCGVYAGVMLNDYLQRIERGSEHSRLPQVMQGNSNSMLAARLAYELDLRGPTATVDTACSSSLVALHLACQSLWLGEADLMVAGGVTLYLTELPYVYMSKAGMLSAHGQERAFDAAADGIVPGEGCAVVVLKPLAKALADGDPVQAIIRATGINSDGRTNGITAPSGRSQAALISDTYQRFGIDPSTVDYVECHGTGTPLGDPIEVAALNEVFAPAGLAAGSVPIGSVKTNVGHTSAAAGLAGLIKAIGVVSTGDVPPTLHLTSPNPRIPFAEGPFTPVTSRRRLPATGRQRRAAVSAFGFSGTNAHVVVEAPPARPASPRQTGPFVVALSGRRPDRIAAIARDLRRWLDGAGATSSVADVAYTLAVARSHYQHRAALVVSDLAELRAGLDRLIAGSPVEESHDVARQYLSGAQVDWASVFADGGFRRLAMPGYVFAKDRHFVSVAPQATPDIDALDLNRPVWVPASPSSEAFEAGMVRIFDPSGELTGLGVESDHPDTLVLRFDQGTVAEAFELAAAVLRAAPRDQLIRVVAVSTDLPNAFAGNAFIRSLAQENPRVSGASLLVDSGPAGLAQLRAELSVRSSGLLDLRGGGRSSLVLESFRPAAPVSLRDGGVYLITGGMGGIGSVLAEHLVSQHNARVVLCGRSAVSLPDGPIRYVQADVSDPAQVSALVRSVLATEGSLHGVFHAAGVVRDAFLTRKRASDVEAVLAPKTSGVVALDAATADLPLDLFVLFSSVAAVTGNIGQTDYAFGNGFLDGFALQRAELVSAGRRHGVTLSVDWPLWDGTGMTVPEPVLRVVEEQVGMTPLPAPLALASLPHLLGAGAPVVSVFHGNRDTWHRHLTSHGLLTAEVDSPAAAQPDSPGGASTKADSPGGASLAAAQAGPLSGASPTTAPARTHSTSPSVTAAVLAAVASALGRSADELSLGTSLESLGLDSLMIRTLAAELSRRVAPVGPEELFGLRDLAELATLLAQRSAPSPAPHTPADAAPTAEPQPHLGTKNASPSAPRGATPEPSYRREGRVDLGGGVAVDKSGDVDNAVWEGELRGSAGDVAVIGVSGRYPGASDLDAFWRNLSGRADTVSELPTDRWADAGGVEARGHFLLGIDRFDPEFFGLSAHDAAMTDPQERLFLEVAWEALEDAGYAGDRLNELVAPDGEKRSLGVFVGVTSGDYQLLGAQQWAHGSRTMPAAHQWSVANRLSYLLDLRGPSQPVDTACSSSLVALHLAAESIRRGECAAALVGGVNLYLHPSRFRMLRQSGFLAEDGRCRSFGAGGTGFGPGEGAGAVLVKPLAQALKDGDNVLAVIKGSAVAHGGRTNGYTAPSPHAQARVIRQALTKAQVDPASVTVIEAHGTGTELGDPVELAGLMATYGSTRNAPRCSVGSVKSNIGHGESVAGLAALTKVLLQLKHRTLLPTLHAEEINPNLRLADTRFDLQREAAPWVPLLDDEGRQLPRRAGVSSFGAGGVNAHVVLEEFIDEQPKTTTDKPQLFVLSAPTKEHLKASAQRLAEWVRANADTIDLAAVARTLREGRAAKDCRLIVVASTAAELADGLLNAMIGERPRGEHALAAAPETAAFLAQLWNNGRLSQVGRLWLDGLDVPWRELDGSTGRLVSLPPSAFLDRPLWFNDRQPTETIPTTVVVERQPVVPTAVEKPVVAEANPVLERLLEFAEATAVGVTGPIDPARALPELGVDSINLMNLRFEIDDRYGLSIPLDELAERTVTELADTILAAAGGGDR
ncbi:SDR family NAD(P)-dependent oxidoreductase [Kutzneria chonburiensis]|uniref:SDR family NAD(P)-dependent oxidoreductase n=1 Tax=Kutzneria chonburiensis TaxID=1483604 RepID=A0ABV6N8F0_9PSEU